MSPRRPTSRNIPFYTDRIEKQQLAVVPETPEQTRSIEIFMEASDGMLQSLLLSRLNIAANLRSDIEILVSELAEKMAEAKLAEILLAQRQRQKPENGE
jgi:hypothetical protein